MATAKLHFSDSTLAWCKAISEAKEEFPLSFEAIKKATEVEIANWHHPLVSISHALLDHFKIVDDPFMLSSFNEDGKPEETGCHCFYATVSYNDLGIFVYDNWGEGNMCAETLDNLRAVLPYPDWLKPHMPILRAIVKERLEAKMPMTEYPEPRPGYQWDPVPELIVKPVARLHDDSPSP